MIKENFSFIALGVVALVVGMLIGASFLKPSPSPVISSRDAYPLINSTVTSNLNKYFIINFLSLRKQLQDIQKNYPQKTYIYFDYLNNASWVGLNEKDLFIAASTVKVPLAMALYKAEEEKKIKMTDVYSLEDLDLDEKFGELYKVGADRQFTVAELVKIMLEQSDNTAMNAIVSIFKKIGIEDPLADVYSSMGWQESNTNLIPEMGGVPNYQDINLKTLANMFLSLYNATYLNLEHSEQILSSLTNTPFADKIAAGVPKDIKVAHKIGIAANYGTFSDCGIVYVPNRNYILCIGANGGKEKDASDFMAEVSKVVYKYVISN